MKKKIWIRVVGVLALLAWGSVGFFAWIYAGAADHRTREGAALLVGFLFMASMALTAAWVVCSAVDWVLRRQAKLQAVSMAQEIRRAMQAGMQQPAPQATAAATAPQPTAAVQPARNPRAVMTSPLGLS